MKISILRFIFALLLLSSMNAFAMDCRDENGVLDLEADSLLCETPEILFESDEEALLIKQKATELGSPVAIYEYLRNNAEFSLYHGARSNSINTFLSLRGNDVDLASTLIAMFRSQGIPSRYVQGDVRIKKSELANWLGVQNEALAVSTLRDQGTQHVNDTSFPNEVVFQHVWVEALISTENYRGAGKAKLVDCSGSNPPASCRWVQLSPSFKQKIYKQLPAGLDILNNVPFDYDAYFNALNPSSPHYDASIQNKNPLEIYEEQVLGYLRSVPEYAHLTLEDVADPGEIIQDNSGLFPSSLPFIGIDLVSVVSYDSVDDHDINENPNWEKLLKTVAVFEEGACEVTTGGSAPPVSVADLSTKKFTVSWIPGEGIHFRLDGVSFHFLGGGTTTFCGILVAPGYRYSLNLEVEGSPHPVTGEISTSVVRYSNLDVGGYHLIALGGETSNWSQVQRAYHELLEANSTYSIVPNHPSTGEPFVDKNSNQSWDEGIDSLLIEDVEAHDALSAGLLYSAQNIYYTRLRESSERIERLQNVSSPIEVYLGLISTTHDVEYFTDDLPFSIMPGGLLIDLKGIRLNGAWKKNQPDSYSDDTFKLLGHLGSSLEHEVWQELTGYDAISTMGGIQKALGQGATLKIIDENSVNTLLTDFGFSTSTPNNFTRENYIIGNFNPALWTYTGAGVKTVSFLRKEKDSYGLLDTPLAVVTITTDELNDIAGTLAQWEIDIPIAAQYFSSTNDETHEYSCDGQTYTMTGAEWLNHWNTCINSWMLSGSRYRHYGFDADFDGIVELSEKTNFSIMHFINREASSGGVFSYADYPIKVEYQEGLIEHDGSDIGSWLRLLQFALGDNFSAEIITPSKLPSGPTYLFNVFIRNFYSDEGNLISSTYGISNKSCRLNSSCVYGGGYVSGEEVINPAEDATFNNTEFTDKSLVGVSNNGLVVTPSTIDPVSTVTGNMYHDETDLVIAGKNLNFAFTRTYNSGPTETTSVSGVQQPLGEGWTHSYNMQLVAREEGANPNYPFDLPVNDPLAPENEPGSGVSSITYIDERGGEMSYLMDENNLNLPPVTPRGSFDALEIDSDPSNCDANGETCYHTITFPNATKYVFEGLNQNATNRGSMRVVGDVARLSRIESPYGEIFQFTYNTQGQLESVEDNLDLGREITFYYDGNGKLETITDWSLPSRSWEYAYNVAGHLESVTKPNTDVMEYTYHDDTHYLKEFIYPADRNGEKKTVTFSYYENGQAYDYVDKQGNAESLSYDLFRKKTRITNPRGFVTVHEYDNFGAMKKLTEPDGGILFFENNADGIRNQKIDALGNTTQYFYNTNTSDKEAASNTFGNVTREKDAINNTVDYDYGIYNQLTEVVDKNGNTRTHTYYQSTDETNHHVAGKVASVSIDQLTSYNNGSPVVHNNVKLKEVLYYADDTEPEFGNVYRVIEYIDPANTTASGPRRVTEFTYSYSSSGFTQTQTTWGENDPNSNNGNSATITRTFDELWRLTSESVQRETSPTNSSLVTLTTSYEYDELGRQIKVTDSAGNIKETNYDANNLVEQVITRYNIASGTPTPLHANCSVAPAYPNHHSCVSMTNTYDEADRLVSVENINGDITSFEYDAMGNVLLTTNAINNTMRHKYDAMGRKTSSTNENGYKTETRYDLNGRVTSVKDANGNETTFAYDALGRTTSTQTELNRTTSVEYDNNSNQTKLTNAANSEIDKLYDELNRVIRVRDAMNADTIYSYDLLGNRTSITDAENQTTRFVFNTLGRLVEEVDPIIETTDKTKLYSYDKVGNLFSFTDRNGETTQNTYDLLNRVISIDYLADATQSTITYDQYGDRIAISNANVTYTYSYDNQHRLLSKTDSRTNQSLSYTYNAVGNVLTKTDYLGNVTTFKYDSTNRLVASTNPAYLNATYQYDAAGRLQSRILSSGAKTFYEYDKDNRLSKLANYAADGSLVEERVYARDELGNIHNINFNSGLSIAYTYDANSRLLTADYSDNSYDVVYTYDDVGNRLTKAINGTTQYYKYSPKGNRLEKVCADVNCNQPIYHYAYDANGSRIAKYDGVNKLIESYAYNQQRLVTAITSPSNGNSSFEYDANAYRIQKTNADDSENNYLLEAEHLEAIYDENNEVKASYLRGVVVDEIINSHEYSNGKKSSLTYHHDQVNSVSALTDHNGVVKQNILYGPFGEALTTSGSSGNKLQYTGRENDANGLYYYRARYYDPEIGRFISEDPLGFEAGINFYAYVENNPLIFNDPSGLEYVSVTWNVAFGGGVHGSAGYDTDTGDVYLGGGVDVGYSMPGGSISASPEPPVEGFTFNVLTSGCLGPCVGQNTQFIPIVGGNENGTPSWEIVTSPVTSLPLSEGGLTGGANLNITINADYTSQVFNVNDAVETVSDIWDSGTEFLFGGSNASNGGFVIYPNKLNSNTMKQVYEK